MVTSKNMSAGQHGAEKAVCESRLFFSAQISGLSQPDKGIFTIKMRILSKRRGSDMVFPRAPNGSG